MSNADITKEEIMAIYPKVAEIIAERNAKFGKPRIRVSRAA